MEDAVNCQLCESRKIADALKSFVRYFASRLTVTQGQETTDERRERRDRQIRYEVKKQQ